MRVGKRLTAVQSGLTEVAELADASEGPVGADQADGGRGRSRYKGGSIEVKNIDMAYGDVQVLHDVSLAVQPGTVTCLIGPSGSGKSTLLRCLNRLVECRAGDILLDGASIYKQTPDQLRRRVLMVFQQFNLFPDRTALANITLALRKVKGMSSEQAEQTAEMRLRDVGLLERKHHRPANLSGGQQQRVAIARALATRSRSHVVRRGYKRARSGARQGRAQLWPISESAA